MKHILLLTLFFVSHGLLSQNWRPVSAGEKFNYRHPDSTFISQVIAVDSVKNDGLDVLFFLNRIVRRCPACPEINDKKAWLRRQGQFLQKVMREKPNGQFVFEGDKNLVLQPFAAVGSSWTFDAADNTTATILSNQVESVFGTPDSVKTISLSNGASFKLSKSFGLLSFPEDAVGNNVMLAGIEGRNVGTLVPDYRAFFDFQPGDVFQYSSEYSYYPVIGHETAKFTILQRANAGDTLRYVVQKNNHVSETYFGDPYNNYTRSDTLT